MDRIGIGIVGTGDIAPRYLDGIARSTRLRALGCAGRSVERTRALADRFGITAFDIAGLVADPAVSIILNLTAPAQHARVSAEALQAGKHVYSEKPLATDPGQADALLTLAGERDRLLACAPATPLGPALQTARRMIDAGAIGDVVGANASVIYPGPELFHRRPSNLYAAGAGPLFDMAVYDVAALHFLLGPIARVAAAGRRMRDRRETLCGPDAGSTFAVEVPTHVAALLEFVSGPVATMTTSFDAVGGQPAGLAIHGTHGALRLGRANQFDATVEVAIVPGEWCPVEPTIAGWNEDLWIVGLLDLAAAITERRAPHCSADAARHVLAVLNAIEIALGGQEWQAVGHPFTGAPPLGDDYYETLREPSPATLEATA